MIWLWSKRRNEIFSNQLFWWKISDSLIMSEILWRSTNHQHLHQKSPTFSNFQDLRFSWSAFYWCLSVEGSMMMMLPGQWAANTCRNQDHVVSSKAVLGSVTVAGCSICSTSKCQRLTSSKVAIRCVIRRIECVESGTI